eukprot:COSAG04_NODE_2819_length_3535_cov_6.638242_1_plen_764_part_00
MDWLKEDHCALPRGNGDMDDMYNILLGKMRDALNATGRKIFFDVCAHACYDAGMKHSPACWKRWYTNATSLGNSWRTTTDINNSWRSVLNNWYRNDAFAGALNLSQFNAPNQWNDPDSLVVGMDADGARGPVLTQAQQRLHFSMWCIMASPLIAGNRLDRMDSRARAILTHPGLIKVNQDPMGIQGIRIQTFGARHNFSDVYGDPLVRYDQEVWAKPMLLYPGQLIQYGFALALVNHDNTSNVTVTASTDVLAAAFPDYLPKSSEPKFHSLELWSGRGAGDVVPGDDVSWAVEPQGVAVITLDPNCMDADNQPPGSAGAPPLKADDDSLSAGSLQFGPPVLLGGQPWHSAAAKTDLRANESFVDTFFALSDTHLFGQYNYYGGPGSTPFVVSTDSGRSWNHSSTACPTEAQGWASSDQGLIGHGRRPARTLRTVGWLGADNGPRGFNSSAALEYSMTASGELLAATRPGNTFEGLPRPIVGRAGDSRTCMAYNHSFFNPVSSIVLSDGSYLAATIVCFADSPSLPWKKTEAARSLVAWASGDGYHWSFKGVITDAKEYVPHVTGYGNTEENDLALTSDGKTIMIVMRTDGDGPCHPPSQGMGEQGVYRPYFQSYSQDNGATWTRMTPIEGTGCARPRLLSLGVGKPLLISGGRMCVENVSSLFVWVNPTGLPNQKWTRYSISYAHNQGWTGPRSFLFDERINATDVFETQAYTSLMQVGDDEAYVTYGKYYNVSNGQPGCMDTWPKTGHGCSSGFGMRISIKG